MKLGPVKTIAEHGAPRCAEDKLFLGMNANGVIAVFDEHSSTNCCFYDVFGEPQFQMCGLVSYQELYKIAD